ncbi:hypothetical protein [Meridianimarinicoccus aquatilis]|uniref:VPLPA-CTERM sorting domain-containing protein n=1 Tax=Meridianimarinicoccus aquatilis TaxID=2552766 RepID=A0A4V3BBQ7_9RHOB|nr:hypothetical protein [Fluviibacterium aquatile]TDL88069.1 hypothetical protein E2L05_09205 [Fluviibacterium aquatile]
MRLIIASGAILPLCATAVMATPVSPFLLADQSADQVVLLQDINGDGDTNDAGEATVYFDASNASGLATPTGNVFSLTQAADGVVYLGDGSTDTVYRTQDIDGDGSANGDGESQVWFSASESVSGFSLNTPNGIAQGPDGAIYVVEADTTGNPSGDWVYRTVDLNGDGYANDAGEVTQWLSLSGLNASSSPFQIDFDGDTAYIADTSGTTPDTIYAARDADGNGMIDSGEVTAFATEGAGTLANFDLAVAAGNGTVYTWQWLADEGIASVFGLTDLDGSGTIDDPSETMELWNTSLLTGTYDFLAGFGMALNDLTGELLITSNDSNSEGDWVMRLLDLDGDGAFWGTGEWSAVASRSDGGVYPDRARQVAFYSASAVSSVPLPASLPILASAISGLALLRRRRRKAL